MTIAAAARLAGHTSDRQTAALILAQGGRCLLRVKLNQQGLHRDLVFLYDDPRTGASRLTFQQANPAKALRDLGCRRP